MKKIKTMSSVLAACIMAAMFTSPAAAMTAFGDVSVPYGTPNIDGTISEGEWDKLKSKRQDHYDLAALRK